MGGQSLGIKDYLSVRAGVVATRAYRVVQQQGYLGFEESTRRDFAKQGGQAIKVMKGIVQGRMETAIGPWSKLYEGCTLLAVCSESICGGA